MKVALWIFGLVIIVSMSGIFLLAFLGKPIPPILVINGTFGLGVITGKLANTFKKRSKKIV